LLQSLDNALDLLELLAKADRDLSLTEIASNLGVNKPKAFRVLRTLTERGYLSQNRETKRYRLGVRVWELGAAARRRLAIREWALPHMRALAQLTGELVTVNIYDHGDVITLERTDGPRFVAVVEPVGFRLPALPTAAGKVLLAFQPLEEIERVCREPLLSVTPRTITSPDEVLEELERVRLRGFAITRGELDLERCAMSVPILDFSYRAIAALSISAPITHFTDDFVERYLPRLREHAYDISLAAGCPEPHVVMSQSLRAPSPLEVGNTPRGGIK
jgi:IclR family transcriptional regulator, KDG regulon repressor